MFRSDAKRENPNRYSRQQPSNPQDLTPKPQTM